jgi:predicted transcriptional regulator
VAGRHARHPSDIADRQPSPLAHGLEPCAVECWFFAFHAFLLTFRFLILRSLPGVAESVCLLDIHSPFWYLDTKLPERGDVMKAMTLRLDETEYERLRTVAFVEDRPVSDVIREAIHDYIQRKASQDEFRASLERAMQESARLIAEMAEY